MKKLGILVVSGLLMLSLCATSFTILDPIADLIKKMDTYLLAHPQEKVHLHLDKPNYQLGDDVWFRAYVVDAGDSKLSRQSGVLNVELINDQDSLMQRLKLQIQNGMASGDFRLNDSLPEGDYHIRAYTRLMQNLSPEFFYHKNIRVSDSSGSRLSTSAVYNYVKLKQGYQVSAVLTFKDKAGKPYASREVSYTVQLGDGSISEGSDRTNADGAINLAWNTTSSLPKAPGRISTVLKLSSQIQISKTIPIKSTADSADVQFFPEGGELVEGIRSKIGVKAINSFGQGENLEGTVVDGSGRIITRFRAAYLGLGSFTFKPEPGTTYLAKLKFEDGSERTIPLPKARTSGYVLAVDNMEAEQVYVSLLASADLLTSTELNVVVQHNGNMLLVFKPVVKSEVTGINIPRKNLPAGIIQLTLFSASMQPLTERLFFNTPNLEPLQTTLSGLKNSYGPRSAIAMELAAKAATNVYPAYYSVSVTNADVVEPDLENESNIFCSLLLTSDLTGFVERPNHYFLDTTLKTRTELDNLLLTQGWRRFLWKDVLSGKLSNASFSAEKNLKISGTVLASNGKGASKAKVSLFAPESGSFSIDTVADANGRFNFDQLVFKDGTKFIVQAANAKGRPDVRLNMDPGPEQVAIKTTSTSRVELHANESIAAYMRRNNPDLVNAPGPLSSQRSIGLKEVKIKATKKTIAFHSSNLNGAGVADQLIKGVDMGTCINLAECLKGRIVGYTLRNDTPFLARSPFIPMMLSLDGVLVDGSRLKDVNPVDIETIEVLKTPINTAIYGSRGIGGIIVINTKRQVGGAYTVHTKPWIVSHRPAGFSESRAFYSPKYEGTNQDKTPDLRRTVYWKPDLRTDAAGKARINFYTGDLPGNYRVVAEGINANGQLGRTVYTYTVTDTK
jgi:hypothetical protein